MHAVTIDVYGVVQGVGFRPQAYLLAKNLGLKGTIFNAAHSVHLQLEGSQTCLEAMIRAIEKLPPPVKVDSVIATWGRAAGIRGLNIIQSQCDALADFCIPPDQVTCSDCLKEFYSPSNRRYLFPFISCSICGPRYSILHSMPYDRIRTSMAPFKLCSLCQEEYQNPFNRRFHAQNSSCSSCGPQLFVANNSHKPLKYSSVDELIRTLTQTIAQGKIIAVKGVGGFQLICDARSSQAVQKIRKWKVRPHEPLAVMARGPEILTEPCSVMELLRSPSGPIVLARGSYGLPLQDLSPDSGCIGIFLPTTALHHFFFGARGVSPGTDFLVVTSGNRHGEPMAISEEEALASLEGIADLFVSHNRSIVRRVDDSLVAGEKGQIWRRSRGFVGSPVIVPHPLASVFALGGDLKNTIAVSCGSRIHVGPHTGNLTGSLAYETFIQDIPGFLRLAGANPKAVAVDLHPAYISGRVGRQFADERELPLLEIQHHVAHGASCLAEHGLIRGIALVFDGTGYGPDGTLWGGEAIGLDLSGGFWERISTLEHAPLPGGEKAIIETERQVHGRLYSAGLLSPDESPWKELLIRPSLCNMTSSMGRLFDSVAALLMPRYKRITYEGQAPVALEALAMKAESGQSYLTSEPGPSVPTTPVFAAIVSDMEKGKAISQIAMNFHQTVADIALSMALYAREKTSLDDICLTGGVFQNRLLSYLVEKRLERQRFRIHQHQIIPSGDGGLSLGQVVFGSAMLNAL